MKPFFTLLGVSFQSLLLSASGVSGRRGKRRQAARAASASSALLLLCIIFAFVSGVFSNNLAMAFAPVGGLDIMLLIMGIMACGYPFIFTLQGAQGQVFSTKDVDLVLSLPVSSFTVMISRVLALFLQGLLMVEVMLIPTGIIYLLNGGAGGAGFMAMLLVAGIFLSFLSTLASLIFGTLISLLISRIRRFKNLFNVLFSVLLMVGLMVGIFALNFVSGAGASGMDLSSIRGGLRGALLPVTWAVDAAMGNAFSLLLLAACTLVPFVLIVWLFSLFYKPLLTSLNSHYLRTDYKLRGVKSSGQFAALFKKEAGKFFGTPAYLLNSGIGILMLLIASVAAVFFKGTLSELLASLAANGAHDLVYNWLPLILIGFILFFGSLVFISCVSISLEGKTLWILKEAPIGTGRLFMAKAGINFVISAVPILICTPLLGYAFSLDVPVIALMLLIGLLFSLFASAAGLFINLLLPRMNAENDTMVIKQSASVIVTMLLEFVLIAGIILLFLAMKPLGFVLYGLTACGILALLSLLAIVLLNTRGRKLFAAL